MKPRADKASIPGARKQGASSAADATAKAAAAALAARQPISVYLKPEDRATLDDLCRNVKLTKHKLLAAQVAHFLDQYRAGKVKVNAEWIDAGELVVHFR